MLLGCAAICPKDAHHRLTGLLVLGVVEGLPAVLIRDHAPAPDRSRSVGHHAKLYQRIGLSRLYHAAATPVVPQVKDIREFVAGLDRASDLQFRVIQPHHVGLKRIIGKSDQPAVAELELMYVRRIALNTTATRPASPARYRARPRS
jgi:hypothetical protein